MRCGTSDLWELNSRSRETRAVKSCRRRSTAAIPTRPTPAPSRSSCRVFSQDQLSIAELEQIGDLLEGAEFIEYVGPGSDGIIAQVIHEMSTPQAKRPITKEAAERWLGLLSD